MDTKVKFIKSIEFCDDDILEVKKTGNNITFIMTSEMATSLLKLEFVNVQNEFDVDEYANKSLLGYISYNNGTFTLPIDNEEDLDITCDDVVINNMEEKDNKHVASLR